MSKVTTWELAQELGKWWLRADGVEHPMAARALAWMIWSGDAFGEAMRALCPGAMGPRLLEADMDTAARAAGHPAGMRALLEEIYREVITDEDGVCAEQGSGADTGCTD